MRSHPRVHALTLPPLSLRSPFLRSPSILLSFSIHSSARRYPLAGRTDLGDLAGFVPTPERGEGAERGVELVAIDCEMCHTALGPELTRVTVVDDVGGVVYGSRTKARARAQAQAHTYALSRTHAHTL